MNVGRTDRIGRHLAVPGDCPLAQAAISTGCCRGVEYITNREIGVTTFFIVYLSQNTRPPRHHWPPDSRVSNKLISARDFGIGSVSQIPAHRTASDSEPHALSNAHEQNAHGPLRWPRVRMKSFSEQPNALADWLCFAKRSPSPNRERKRVGHSPKKTQTNPTQDDRFGQPIPHKQMDKSK